LGGVTPYGCLYFRHADEDCSYRGEIFALGFAAPIFLILFGFFMAFYGHLSSGIDFFILALMMMLAFPLARRLYFKNHPPD
ncbi:MAG: hypothetical protein AAGJ52_04220, partial [Pseudomonadota bacterium]